MKRKNNQITTKQHFVPKFYLKKFSNENEFLEILDLKNRRLAKKRPYASVCYEHYFYGIRTGNLDEISQLLEGYFNNIESKSALFIEDFIPKILNHNRLNDEEIYNMAFIISVFWIRSKYFRESLNKMTSKFNKKVNKMKASNREYFHNEAGRSKEYRDKIINSDDIEKKRQIILEGEYDIKYENKTHLMFFKEFEKYANIFFNKNWRIYIADEENNFITSDTPVIEKFPKWALEKKFYWGPSINQRIQYFPLSPKILIELIEPISGKKVIRKHIKNEDVFRFNVLRMDYSWEYCYSDNKAQFEKAIELAKNKVMLNIKRKLINF